MTAEVLQSDEGGATSGIPDGSVTAEKLGSMGAITGQVLTWLGTTWGPADSPSKGDTGATGATGPMGPQGAHGSTVGGDPRYPDGFEGDAVQVWISTYPNYYRVSEGKTLYIEHLFKDSSEDGYSAKIRIDNTHYFIAGNNYDSIGSLMAPILVSSGSIVYTDRDVPTLMTGMEIAGTVTPVRLALDGSNPYVVPAGRALYVLTTLSPVPHYGDLLVDGRVLVSRRTDQASYAVPIRIGAGTVVTASTCCHRITGYLK